MKAVKIIVIIVDILLIGAGISLYVLDGEISKNLLESIGIVKDKVEVDTIALGEDFDVSKITKTEDYIKSDNEYEEDIINKSENGIYKLKKFKIDNFDAFMLIVYDPANVRLMTSEKWNTPDNSGKERITAMVERTGAVAGINGGGFYDDGHVSKDIPMGYIIKDGEILWNYKNRKGLIIGFSNDNKLIMLDNVTGEQAVAAGMRDGIEFGPALMREGKITEEAKLARWEGKASRVVMAQREDGVVIMLATNGGTVGGVNMSKILAELQNYNVYNVANLDGGASTQMVVEGELLTNVKSALGRYVNGGRLVINGWGVFKPEE